MRRCFDDIRYKKYGEKCYEYALKQTTKELNQAVEGMYHNLNTLQSRSGNQLEVYVAA
jgi:ribonucleoside-triphosphate reductase